MFCECNQLLTGLAAIFSLRSLLRLLRRLRKNHTREAIPSKKITPPMTEPTTIVSTRENPPWAVFGLVPDESADGTEDPQNHR